MASLDEKVALVTGGGTGIGAAIAEAFSAAGARVVEETLDRMAGRAARRSKRLVSLGAHPQIFRDHAPGLWRW
jgi:3-oxoacyl-[acyl-carrier protein] reductase